MKNFINSHYKLIICLVLSAVLVISFSIYSFASGRLSAGTGALAKTGATKGANSAKVAGATKEATSAKVASATDVSAAASAQSSAQSETEPEEAIEPRTNQWTALNVPVKISDIIVTEDFTRAPGFNHINYDFEYLPGAKNANEFAVLSNFAKSLLGVKYTAGGKNPSSGFDCSGFALYVLRRCGSEMLAASCQEQFECCYEIPSGYEEPGDLVFFTGTGYDPSSPVLSHVGIYLGDNLMIHAGTAGICIVNVTDPYWVQHFACFGRPTI